VSPVPAALHVVLLAGGGGTRFWPWSRAARPKQLLPLAGKHPMLVDAWRRARALCPTRRIWVVAPPSLVPSIRRLLPALAEDRLLVEPGPRGTGPAVALACGALARHGPETLAAVLPTDQVVRDREAFRRAIAVASGAAAAGSLVCLGVPPRGPATGFGWLECGTRPSAGRAVPVRRFVEKPPLAAARRYLRSGRHLWNAGMFVWCAGRFLEEAERVAPRLARAVERHLDGDGGAWERAPRVSVDHAVMEHARDVRVVRLDAGWDDLGSWDAVAEFARSRGSAPRVLVDSPGTAVFGSRAVAVVGVPEAIVVDTPDAVLVVSRARAQDVREVVARLRRLGREDLL
jgi:mannose-1-phosphate guanylyltransferase/mannose-6-phosphate isomerase